MTFLKPHRALYGERRKGAKPMKSKSLLLDIDLSLFDGAEGAVSAPTGETKGETVADNNAIQTTGSPTGTDAADTRADEEGDIKVTSNTLEEKRKAYNDLIKGEYKDFYTEDTQRIIDRRFKETKQLEAELEGHRDIMDMLKLRYGVDEVADLQKAIEDDDSYWESAALEAGMSVEQYKQFSKLERENRALLEAQQQRQAQDRVNKQLESWYKEAEALKGQYPGFDLAAEIANPQFLNLLKAKVPLEHAYKLIHMDEIVNSAVATSAADAERKTVENIRARGQRPAENGTSSQGSFMTKYDVHSLSKKERAELIKRAARGEVIEF